MNKFSVRFVFVFVLLVVGCSSPEPTSTSAPTVPDNTTDSGVYPPPTIIYPTFTPAYPAPGVIAEATSPPVSEVPTVAPPYPIPVEPDPNREKFLIISPGLTSAVTSPVIVNGEADSTFEQNLVVLITGSDGNQLALQPTIIQAELGQRGSFSVEVPFSIAEDQPGRISVYDSSAMNGALNHLSSVEVLLLASGTASILGPKSGEEEIVISSPEMQVTVSGGTVEVSGASAYFFEAVLNIVVCGAGGSGDYDLLCGSADNIVGSGLAMIDAPDIGLPGTFSGSATYTVTEAQWGQVIVYAISARDGGVIHAESVLVYLEP